MAYLSMIFGGVLSIIIIIEAAKTKRAEMYYDYKKAKKD